MGQRHLLPRRDPSPSIQRVPQRSTHRYHLAHCPRLAAANLRQPQQNTRSTSPLVQSPSPVKLRSKKRPIASEPHDLQLRVGSFFVRSFVRGSLLFIVFGHKFRACFVPCRSLTTAKTKAEGSRWRGRSGGVKSRFFRANNTASDRA